MRIIKEFLIIQPEETVYEQNSNYGLYIDELNHAAEFLSNEEFIQTISDKSLKPVDIKLIGKIPLHLFIPTLNRIDEILLTSQLKEVLLMTSFLNYLTKNTSSKDVFSSFDRLEAIFLRVDEDSELKMEIDLNIIEIYLTFSSNKKILEHVAFVEELKYSVHLRNPAFKILLSLNQSKTKDKDKNANKDNKDCSENKLEEGNNSEEISTILFKALQAFKQNELLLIEPSPLDNLHDTNFKGAEEDIQQSNTHSSGKTNPDLLEVILSKISNNVFSLKDKNISKNPNIKSSHDYSCIPENIPELERYLLLKTKLIKFNYKKNIKLNKQNKIKLEKNYTENNNNSNNNNNNTDIVTNDNNNNNKEYYDRNSTLVTSCHGFKDLINLNLRKSYHFLRVIKFLCSENTRTRELAYLFIISCINLIFLVSKSTKTMTAISEHYIESYLKSILNVLISTDGVLSIDFKIRFFQQAMIFITDFEGYEDILFQNSLINNIISDMTGAFSNYTQSEKDKDKDKDKDISTSNISNSNSNSKEKILTIEEIHNSQKSNLIIMDEKTAKNQDYLNMFLGFLFKTQSFKEIPPYLLSNILCLPIKVLFNTKTSNNNNDNTNKMIEDDVKTEEKYFYPFRIDNIMFSIKKKKGIPENTLNEVVIPRLIFEINHFFDDLSKLAYYNANANDNNNNNNNNVNDDFYLLDNNKRSHLHEYPTLEERTKLLRKLFNILFVILDGNLNTNGLRNHEKDLFEAIRGFLITNNKCLAEYSVRLDDIKQLESKINLRFKSKEINQNEYKQEKRSIYNLKYELYALRDCREMIFHSIIDFLQKYMNFSPTKIPYLFYIAQAEATTNTNTNTNNNNTNTNTSNMMVVEEDTVNIVTETAKKDTTLGKYITQEMTSRKEQPQSLEHLNLSEVSIIELIYIYLNKTIPRQNGIKASLFYFIYSLTLNIKEDALKLRFIQFSNNTINLFFRKCVFSEEYFNNSVFSLNELVKDEFLAHYSIFIKIDHYHEIIKNFFDEFSASIVNFNKYLVKFTDAIVNNDYSSFSSSSNNNGDNDSSVIWDISYRPILNKEDIISDTGYCYSNKIRVINKNNTSNTNNTNTNNNNNNDLLDKEEVNFHNFKFAYFIDYIYKSLNILLSLTKEEIQTLIRDRKIDFQPIIFSLFKLLTNPLVLYSVNSFDICSYLIRVVFDSTEKMNSLFSIFLDLVESSIIKIDSLHDKQVISTKVKLRMLARLGYLIETSVKSIFALVLFPKTSNVNLSIENQNISSINNVSSVNIVGSIVNDNSLNLVRTDDNTENFSSIYDYIENRINRDSLNVSSFEVNNTNTNTNNAENINLNTSNSNSNANANNNILSNNIDILTQLTSGLNQNFKPDIASKIEELDKKNDIKHKQQQENEKSHRLLTIVTTILNTLVTNQSSINYYMSPVNDALLAMENNTYYKFLSHSLSEQSIKYLTNHSINSANETNNYTLFNTPANKDISAKIIYFNELTAFGNTASIRLNENFIKNPQNKEFLETVKLEDLITNTNTNTTNTTNTNDNNNTSTNKIDENNNNKQKNNEELSKHLMSIPFSFKNSITVNIIESLQRKLIINTYDRIITDAHLKPLDVLTFFCKSMKKTMKDYNFQDVNKVKNWNFVALFKIKLLRSLNFNSKEELISLLNSPANYVSLADNLIYFINIVNNLNILLNERNVSSYVVFAFIKNNGLVYLMRICEYMIEFSLALEAVFGTTKQYLMFCLLIKNLWNVTSNLISKVFQTNFNQNYSFSIFLHTQGIYSIEEYLGILKVKLLEIYVERFIKRYSIKTICNASPLLMEMMLFIMSISMNTWRGLIISRHKKIKNMSSNSNSNSNSNSKPDTSNNNNNNNNNNINKKEKEKEKNKKKRKKSSTDSLKVNLSTNEANDANTTEKEKDRTEAEKCFSNKEFSAFFDIMFKCFKRKPDRDLLEKYCQQHSLLKVLSAMQFINHESYSSRPITKKDMESFLLDPKNKDLDEIVRKVFIETTSKVSYERELNIQETNFLDINFDEFDLNTENNNNNTSNVFGTEKQEEKKYTFTSLTDIFSKRRNQAKQNKQDKDKLDNTTDLSISNTNNAVNVNVSFNADKHHFDDLKRIIQTMIIRNQYVEKKLGSLFDCIYKTFLEQENELYCCNVSSTINFMKKMNIIYRVRESQQIDKNLMVINTRYLGLQSNDTNTNTNNTNTNNINTSNAMVIESDNNNTDNNNNNSKSRTKSKSRSKDNNKDPETNNINVNTNTNTNNSNKDKEELKNILFKRINIDLIVNEIHQDMLIPFIKDIFILEREDLLHFLETNSNKTYDISRMLKFAQIINYVINRNRSKVANIYDTLDTRAVSEFINQYKVFERCLNSINIVVDYVNEKKSELVSSINKLHKLSVTANSNNDKLEVLVEVKDSREIGSNTSNDNNNDNQNEEDNLATNNNNTKKNKKKQCSSNSSNNDNTVVVTAIKRKVEELETVYKEHLLLARRTIQEIVTNFSFFAEFQKYYEKNFTILDIYYKTVEVTNTNTNTNTDTNNNNSNLDASNNNANTNNVINTANSFDFEKNLEQFISLAVKLMDFHNTSFVDYSIKLINPNEGNTNNNNNNNTNITKSISRKDSIHLKNDTKTSKVSKTKARVVVDSKSKVKATTNATNNNNNYPVEVVSNKLYSEVISEESISVLLNLLTNTMILYPSLKHHFVITCSGFKKLFLLKQHGLSWSEMLVKKSNLRAKVTLDELFRNFMFTVIEDETTYEDLLMRVVEYVFALHNVQVIRGDTVKNSSYNNGSSYNSGLYSNMKSLWKNARDKEKEKEKDKDKEKNNVTTISRNNSNNNNANNTNVNDNTADNKKDKDKELDELNKNVKVEFEENTTTTNINTNNNISNNNNTNTNNENISKDSSILDKLCSHIQKFSETRNLNNTITEKTTTTDNNIANNLDNNLNNTINILETSNSQPLNTTNNNKNTINTINTTSNSNENENENENYENLNLEIEFESFFFAIFPFIEERKDLVNRIITKMCSITAHKGGKYGSGITLVKLNNDYSKNIPLLVKELASDYQEAYAKSQNSQLLPLLMKDFRGILDSQVRKFTVVQQKALNYLLKYIFEGTMMLKKRIDKKLSIDFDCEYSVNHLNSNKDNSSNSNSNGDTACTNISNNNNNAKSISKKEFSCEEKTAFITKTDQQTYYFLPVDTLVMSLGSLVKAYPKIIFMLHKFHVNISKGKSIFFLDFLTTHYGLVSCFMTSCYYDDVNHVNNASTVLEKDFETPETFLNPKTTTNALTIGFEPNNRFSVLEGIRNVLLYSGLIQGVCLRRRLNQDDADTESSLKQIIANTILGNTTNNTNTNNNLSSFTKNNNFNITNSNNTNNTNNNNLVLPEDTAYTTTVIKLLQKKTLSRVLKQIFQTLNEVNRVLDQSELYFSIVNSIEEKINVTTTGSSNKKNKQKPEVVVRKFQVKSIHKNKLIALIKFKSVLIALLSLVIFQQNHSYSQLSSLEVIKSLFNLHSFNVNANSKVSSNDNGKKQVQSISIMKLLITIMKKFSVDNYIEVNLHHLGVIFLNHINMYFDYETLVEAENEDNNNNNNKELLKSTKKGNTSNNNTSNNNNNNLSNLKTARKKEKNKEDDNKMIIESSGIGGIGGVEPISEFNTTNNNTNTDNTTTNNNNNNLVNVNSANANTTEQDEFIDSPGIDFQEENDSRSSNNSNSVQEEGNNSSSQYYFSLSSSSESDNDNFFDDNDTDEEEEDEENENNEEEENAEDNENDNNEDNEDNENDNNMDIEIDPLDPLGVELGLGGDAGINIDRLNRLDGLTNLTNLSNSIPGNIDLRVIERLSQELDDELDEIDEMDEILAIEGNDGDNEDSEEYLEEDGEEDDDEEEEEESNEDDSGEHHSDNRSNTRSNNRRNRNRLDEIRNTTVTTTNTNTNNTNNTNNSVNLNAEVNNAENNNADTNNVNNNTNNNRRRGRGREHSSRIRNISNISRRVNELNNRLREFDEIDGDEVYNQALSHARNQNHLLNTLNRLLPITTSTNNNNNTANNNNNNNLDLIDGSSDNNQDFVNLRTNSQGNTDSENNFNNNDNDNDNDNDMERDSYDYGGDGDNEGEEAEEYHDNEDEEDEEGSLNDIEVEDDGEIHESPSHSVSHSRSRSRSNSRSRSRSDSQALEDMFIDEPEEAPRGRGRRFGIIGRSVNIGREDSESNHPHNILNFLIGGGHNLGVNVNVNSRGIGRAHGHVHGGHGINHGVGFIPGDYNSVNYGHGHGHGAHGGHVGGFNRSGIRSSNPFSLSNLPAPGGILNSISNMGNLGGINYNINSVNVNSQYNSNSNINSNIGLPLALPLPSLNIIDNNYESIEDRDRSRLRHGRSNNMNNINNINVSSSSSNPNINIINRINNNLFNYTNNQRRSRVDRVDNNHMRSIFTLSSLNPHDTQSTDVYDDLNYILNSGSNNDFIDDLLFDSEKLSFKVVASKLTNNILQTPMIPIVYDYELSEINRPLVFFSMINKLNRHQAHSTISTIMYLYLSPFNRSGFNWNPLLIKPQDVSSPLFYYTSMTKFVLFTHKEKVLNQVVKEIHAVEKEFVVYRESNVENKLVSEIDSYESVKEFLLQNTVIVNEKSEENSKKEKKNALGNDNTCSKNKEKKENSNITNTRRGRYGRNKISTVSNVDDNDNVSNSRRDKVVTVDSENSNRRVTRRMSRLGRSNSNANANNNTTTSVSNLDSTNLSNTENANANNNNPIENSNIVNNPNTNTNAAPNNNTTTTNTTLNNTNNSRRIRVRNNRNERQSTVRTRRGARLEEIEERKEEEEKDNEAEVNPNNFTNNINTNIDNAVSNLNQQVTENNVNTTNTVAETNNMVIDVESSNNINTNNNTSNNEILQASTVQAVDNLQATNLNTNSNNNNNIQNQSNPIVEEDDKSDIDQDYLLALPEELREEAIEQFRLLRLARRTRKRQRSYSNMNEQQFNSSSNVNIVTSANNLSNSGQTNINTTTNNNNNNISNQLNTGSNNTNNNISNAEALSSELMDILNQGAIMDDFPLGSSLYNIDVLNRIDRVDREERTIRRGTFNRDDRLRRRFENPFSDSADLFMMDDAIRDYFNNKKGKNETGSRVRDGHKATKNYLFAVPKLRYNIRTLTNLDDNKKLIKDVTKNFVSLISKFSASKESNNNTKENNTDNENDLDEFLEHIVIFNFKLTCDNSTIPQIDNQYWNLILTLMQNTELRVKLMDILILLWVLDSQTLKKTNLIEYFENPAYLNDVVVRNRLNKQGILGNTFLKKIINVLKEIQAFEEFFFADFSDFFNKVSDKYPHEMRRFFMDTKMNINLGSILNKEKHLSNSNNIDIRSPKACLINSNNGLNSNKYDYLFSTNSPNLGKMNVFKYNTTKNCSALKAFLVNFTGTFISQDSLNAYFSSSKNLTHVMVEENTISVLIRLMLSNTNSEIKKIYTVGVLQKITKMLLSPKLQSLKISKASIDSIIDLYYDFETQLIIQREKRTNNPAQLLIQMITDYNTFKTILNSTTDRIIKLNKDVLENLLNYKKTKISNPDLYTKPFPENVMFRIIKLLNRISNFLHGNNKSSSIGGFGDNNNNFGSNNNNFSSSNANQRIQNDNDSNVAKLGSKEQNKNKRLSALEKTRLDIANTVKLLNEKLFEVYKQFDILLSSLSYNLKEDQNLIDPKLDRLVPYIEAFITMSHLQFSFGNDIYQSALNDTDKKFIIKREYTKTADENTPQHDFFSNTNKDYFIEFFLRFCMNNKKIINLMLRRYPKMFPNDMILKISKFLDLKNKKKYFKMELRKLKPERYENISITVNRAFLLSSSYEKIRKYKGEDLRNKLTIKFSGEEAVDAGGVKREWLTLLSKEIFNPNLCLFKLAANGVSYIPNENSGMFDHENSFFNHLEFFRFTGRTIAKAVYDGFLLECHFTRGFYKLITNTPLTYHDMEDYDPEHYKSLKWLLDNNITDLDLGFTFSYVDDKFGKIELKELIENGENVDVTEENKFDYVQKISEAKLYGSIKAQVDAFLEGFYSVIPQKMISIFSHRELELLISGLPSIDVLDLKANTIYENYSETSQVCIWFWEIIQSMDQSEQAEFLQFVTGSSKVPLEGFSALQGIGGINKFKLCRNFDKNYDRLPTAHTCTNQLDLPNYPSKEILHERLMTAIKEGKGFGFI